MKKNNCKNTLFGWFLGENFNIFSSSAKKGLEHYLKLSNICAFVTGWVTATDRAALIVDSSIAAKSLLAGKQYNGSERVSRYNRIIITIVKTRANINLIRHNYQSWTSNITGKSAWVRSVHFSSQYLKLHRYSTVHIEGMSVYPEASPCIALKNQKLVQPICQNPTRHQVNITLGWD